MSTNKIYKPQENHFQLKFISPGAICKFNRYPFYYMTSEQFASAKERLEVATARSFLNDETTIYESIDEDRFVFLRTEIVNINNEDKDTWNIGAFLYNEQVVFIAEDILEDSAVTVLT